MLGSVLQVMDLLSSDIRSSVCFRNEINFLQFGQVALIIRLYFGIFISVACRGWENLIILSDKMAVTSFSHRLHFVFMFLIKYNSFELGMGLDPCLCPFRVLALERSREDFQEARNSSFFFCLLFFFV